MPCLIRQLHRIAKADKLIRSRATGCPEAFACKLGLSRSGMFKFVKALKHELDLPIEYDCFAQTYFYSKAGKFVFGFVFDGER